MLIASIVLFDSVKSYDFPYDYYVPEDISLVPGVRVTVPFGSGKNRRVGFVVSLRNEEKEGLKEIEEVIDHEPLLNSEGLNLVYYLHKTTFCLWYEAVKCQIPPGLGMKVSMGYSCNPLPEEISLSPEERRIYDILSENRKLLDEKTFFEKIGVSGETKEIRHLLKLGCISKAQKIRKRILDKKAVTARLLPQKGKEISLTPRQQEVKNLLSDMGEASVKEISYFLGISSSVLKTMEKKGVIELFEKIIPIDAGIKEEEPEEKKEITLNRNQQQVFEGIREKMHAFSVNLLYGVTGSGKTEVFIKLIEEASRAGKTSLVLIPEISLTPQTAKKFKSYFGSKVAVLNSTLSMTERLEQYERIKSGRCPIVVGTRLSVFSPLENIGLIVIDEEQETTYHSEQSPRFDARSVAQIRAKYHSCPLLLCSATPSVESFFKAKTGKYELFTLKERFSKKPLPPVYMIDMLKESPQGDSVIFSQRLCEEMRYNLDHKEQTVLLLNRRGYLTRLSCISCRETIKCPNCSVAMTYHKGNNRLMCHMCGYQCSVPKACPSCGGKMMKFQGEGTQKAEDELKNIFPEARILRMDADTTLSKDSHQKGFEDFREGKYDILIGTQMISKGLNFPLVTLVGIINADQALFTEDFRGFEKAFSLITQTVGRAGRGKLEGRAFIQTFSPDLELFKFCKREDYESFYNEEIGFRESCLYPPYCDMVKITFRSQNEVESYHDAKFFCEAFVSTADEKYPGLPLRVLGPSQGSPYKKAGFYYMQILLKCRVTVKLLSLLEDCSNKYYREKRPSILAIDTSAV